MAYGVQKRFAFEKLPSDFRGSIIKAVDFKERLKLLSSTKAIRQEVLCQGLIRQKIGRLVVDFSNFRIEDGKLRAENLYIYAHPDDQICFGQREVRAMHIPHSIYSHFYRLTPTSWPLFQRLRPRLLGFGTRQHEAKEKDDFDVFQFLPKVDNLYDLQIMDDDFEENVTDAFFNNFHAKFTEVICCGGYKWGLTKHFEDTFLKHYSECQIVTLSGPCVTEFWEPLKKTSIQLFEVLPATRDALRIFLEKTVIFGLPLEHPGAEMVVWKNDRQLEVFPKLLAIFQRPETLAVLLDAPQEFKPWPDRPRRTFVEAHYFRKNINGIDYAWRVARDHANSYVFVRKLDAYILVV